MAADLYRRRRLRLGALLFRLQYYAVTEHCDEDGQITLYRRNALQWVQVTGTSVRFVDGDRDETLDLESAIERCRALTR